MTEPTDYAATLADLGAANLGDSVGRPMCERIREAWAGSRVAAPAFTVQCAPGDNLALHVAVAEAPEGCALVVDVGDLRERGYFGDLLCAAAVTRGLAGVVIDGGVCDVDGLEAQELPAFSACISLRSTTSRGPGFTGEPIRCGGALVETGDWVVADADGVTIVPFELVDDAIEQGRAEAEREAEWFDELRAGATTIDLLALDDSSIVRGGGRGR